MVLDEGAKAGENLSGPLPGGRIRLTDALPRKSGGWVDVEAGVASRSWTLGALSEILDNFVLFPTDPRVAVRQQQVTVDVLETDPSSNPAGFVNEMVIHANSVGLSYQQLRKLLSSHDAAEPDCGVAPWPIAAACMRVAPDCLVVSKSSEGIVAGIISRRLQEKAEETCDLLAPCATLGAGFASLPSGDNEFVGCRTSRVVPSGYRVYPGEDGDVTYGRNVRELAGIFQVPEFASPANVEPCVMTPPSRGVDEEISAQHTITCCWQYCSGAAGKMCDKCLNHASAAAIEEFAGLERLSRLRKAVSDVANGTFMVLYNMATLRELSSRDRDIVLLPPDQAWSHIVPCRMSTFHHQ